MQNKSDFHGKWNMKQIFISVFLSFFLFFRQSVSLIEIEMSITKEIMFSLIFTMAGDLTCNSIKSLPIPQTPFPHSRTEKKNNSWFRDSELKRMMFCNLCLKL